MVCCCIFGCSNNSNKNKGVGFYLVPKVISWQCSKTYNLSSERRALWLKRINRQNFNEKTIEGSRVCGVHFATGKPSTLFDNNNVDWAPSLALGYEEDEELEYKRGRWVKCKKKKLINIKTVTSTSATQSGDFIMLDGVDCDSETINILKLRKNKNVEEDTASSSSSSITKNVDSKSKELYHCLEENLNNGDIDSNFKDVSCQTDIKCEYIGHLETHVVHLRSEVKNLKQQIEQYEAYYQMLHVNENNGTNSERNSTVKFEGELDGSPQSKKYKLMIKSPRNQSPQNESNLYCEDENMSEEDYEEDYTPLIPQIVIKEEPEDLSDNDNMSDDVNIKTEEVILKPESNESQNCDSQSSCDQDKSEHLAEVKSQASELNDNNSDNKTNNQIRKSARSRKCSKILLYDSQTIVESIASNVKTPRHNAYSLWSKEKRAEIMKNDPEIDFSTISKLLAEMWKKVKKSEKNNWQTRAKRVNNGILKARKEMKEQNNSDDSKVSDSSSQ